MLFWPDYILYGSGQIEPLPACFEKPEPVHRFYGQHFLEPGNYPGNVNRATALVMVY
jgi:hypothetical protein